MTRVELVESYGFRVVPRAEFQAVESLNGFKGASDAERARRLDRINAYLLKRRARPWPGLFVLYDPAADREGLLLIGDNAEALAAEAAAFLELKESRL